MASESLANPSPMSIGRSTFRFVVDYYKSKDLPVGTCITSPTFTDGGCDWALEYYPQGDTPEEHGSHVSLYLCLKREVKDIAAEYYFEVFDNKGKFVRFHLPEVNNFTSGRESRGYANFITRDTIEKFYCMNGILVIWATLEYSRNQHMFRPILVGCVSI